MSDIQAVTLIGVVGGQADAVTGSAAILKQGVPVSYGFDKNAVASPVAKAAGLSITDQVQLSKAAEARSMRAQGQSLAEIEATLGLSESTVTGYLGITSGTQSLVAAAAAVVEAKVAQATAVPAGLA